MDQTDTGNTTEEFEKTVKDWIATARHPKTGRLYTDMVYQRTRRSMGIRPSMQQKAY